VGIGTAAPIAAFDANINFSAASGNEYASRGTVQFTPASGATSSSTGVSGSVFFNGANTPSAKAIGIDGAVVATWTGTLGSATAVNGYIGNVNGGTISDATGGMFQVQNSNGTITNAIGVLINNVQGTNRWALYSVDSGAQSYFAGRVGIGVINPGYLLHVNGTAVAAAWNTSSDIRLKENIHEIQDPLDKILQLRAIEFDWRKDVPQTTAHEKTHDVGVIAQEVEKVFPEVVMDGADGYKSVSYSKLISPMIGAVKALYEKITVSADRITQLEAENVRKTKEIEDLRQRLDRIEKALH
jgi:hypothetical protein